MNALTTPRDDLVRLRPRTANQLHAFIHHVLGFEIPRRALAPGHDAPFSYVCHTFFEDTPGTRDCLVWANRGGGKTQLAAIVTLLEMIFKPSIQIRILAGSFEQSCKMYGYLKTLLERDLFIGLVKGRITGRFVELTNGSRVEVLGQSECAVRGQRVHKLRCDEIELIDDDIWRAAQMVTRSGQCGEVYVHGAVEAVSTMHRPFGLMQKLIDEARSGVRRLFRWNVIDVLERCPPDRDCDQCPIWDDCGGRAKKARGFLRIDDAIAQHRRVSEDAWRSEMLCERPSVSDRVYPEFEPNTHVRAFIVPRRVEGVWLGGIDFGFRAPTVLLWAWLDHDEDVLYIVDEYVVRERTTRVHIEQVRERPWPQPTWIGADPAGHQRSEHTGQSTIALWRQAGFVIRTQRRTIDVGIEAVRVRLRRADGAIGLVVHPRCGVLIDSLLKYHYPPDRREDRSPVKDGPDHAADALRYLVVNLDVRVGRVTMREY